MERLTNRNAEIPLPDSVYATYWALVHEKLARYEDAEQDGRLVVLPCKVGDTVFVIKDTDSFAETVVPVKVAAIKVTRGKDPIVHFGGTYPLKWAFSSELGKSFFLTRAEAEAAMKGGCDDA